jgi:hypothetical protein
MEGSVTEYDNKPTRKLDIAPITSLRTVKGASIP